MPGYSPGPDDTTMPSTVDIPKPININHFGGLIQKNFGKGGTLFQLANVEKVTGSGGTKIYERLILLKASYLIVALKNGKISRVVKHWSIEKASYRPLANGVEFILSITGESTLVFRDTSEDPWRVLEILNKCRFYLATPPGPLPICLLKSSEDAKQLYDFKKRKSQDPKGYLKAMKSGTNLEELRARTRAQREGFQINSKKPDITIELPNKGNSPGLVISPDLTILRISSNSPAEKASAGRFVGGKITHVNGKAITALAEYSNNTRELVSIPLCITLPPLEKHSPTDGEETITITKQPADEIGISISEDMALSSVTPDMAADSSGASPFTERKIIAINDYNVNNKDDMSRFKNEVSIKLTFAPKETTPEETEPTEDQTEKPKLIGSDPLKTTEVQEVKASNIQEIVVKECKVEDEPSLNVLPEEDVVVGSSDKLTCCPHIELGLEEVNNIQDSISSGGLQPHTSQQQSSPIVEQHPVSSLRRMPYVESNRGINSPFQQSPAESPTSVHFADPQYERKHTYESNANYDEIQEATLTNHNITTAVQDDALQDLAQRNQQTERALMATLDQIRASESDEEQCLNELSIIPLLPPELTKPGRPASFRTYRPMTIKERRVARLQQQSV